LGGNDDTRDEGDVVVYSTGLKPNSGKSIFELPEGDVTPFSRTLETRRVLCRVLGPTGVIVGRFNSVLARDALRMLPESDMVHPELE